MSGTWACAKTCGHEVAQFRTEEGLGEVDACGSEAARRLPPLLSVAPSLPLTFSLAFPFSRALPCLPYPLRFPPLPPSPSLLQARTRVCPAPLGSLTSRIRDFEARDAPWAAVAEDAIKMLLTGRVVRATLSLTALDPSIRSILHLPGRQYARFAI
eukprot:6185153-Pleurochrysis_carterae.AAC.2